MKTYTFFQKGIQYVNLLQGTCHIYCNSRSNTLFTYMYLDLQFYKFVTVFGCASIYARTICKFTQFEIVLFKLQLAKYKPITNFW